MPLCSAFEQHHLGRIGISEDALLMQKQKVKKHK